MPVQPVTLQRLGKTGKVIKRQDHLGGIFAPVTGKAQVPAWSFGGGKLKSPMFQCPISAIPAAVWDTLYLWNMCRTNGVMPRAGGLLDQPMVVQRCFPILWAEYKKATAASGGSSAQQAAMMAVGAVATALTGGKGKR